jgi:3'-phosphoadenosine 5'-phosphosulfate sulfotransferase (PAPS reductase)/FAD synthetase
MDINSYQEELKKYDEEKKEKEIITESINKYKVNRFIILFSGGKDSLTLSHFLHNKLKINNLELLYCKTGIGVKENIEYVLEICKNYNWKLNIIEPLPHETYEKYISKFGFPGTGQHGSIMGFLKYHPMRKWYTTQQKNNPDQKIVLFSGRRLGESKRRKKIMKKHTYLSKVDGMVFCSPLFYWSDKQIWDYIHKENLSICPVYNTLHISGDCLCGAYGSKDEYNFLRIFHKDTFDFIQKLEQIYNKKWGHKIQNGFEYKTVKIGKQTKLTSISTQNYICNDCMIPQ